MKMEQNNASGNISQDSSLPHPQILASITWNILRNPLFLTIYLLPCPLNGVVVVTIFKDPLKCLRSCSSYLVFNLGLLGFLPLLTLIIHVLTLSVHKELNLCEFVYCFAFLNTVFAVLMLTTDRYFLVCKPLHYTTIVTKTRALYCAIFSWILSGIFAAAVFSYVHNVVGVVLATKIYVFTLLPIFCFLMIVILTLNIKTWQTVACRGNCVASLNRQNGNMAKKSQNRADKKTLENERRFSKVVLLLLLNLVFFVLPQVLLIVIRCVNIWCESCITEFGSSKVSLLQFYLFPLFYITTPVLYIAFIPKYRKSCGSLFLRA